MRLSVTACFGFQTAVLILASGVIAQDARKLAKGNKISTNVIVTGLTTEGLDLIPPSSPDFDPAVLRLFPANLTGPVLGLKPFLAILSNQSGHTVVAYTIIWKVIHKDRNTETFLTPILYPDAVAGIAGTGALAFTDPEDLPILNREERLVSIDTAFAPPGQKLTPNGDANFLNWLHATSEQQNAEIADVAELQISLDAVIYSDGILVGPDTSNLDRGFTAKLEAKQRLFRQVVSDLDAGRTVEEALEPAKTLGMQRPVPSRDPSAVYETIAAQEIVALRRRIGDSAVPVVFRQAIRKAPFVIRKNSTK